MLLDDEGVEANSKRLEAKLLRRAAQILSMPEHRALFARRAEALDREADELELALQRATKHA